MSYQSMAILNSIIDNHKRTITRLRKDMDIMQKTIKELLFTVVNQKLCILDMAKFIPNIDYKITTLFIKLELYKELDKMTSENIDYDLLRKLSYIQLKQLGLTDYSCNKIQKHFQLEFDHSMFSSSSSIPTGDETISLNDSRRSLNVS